MLDDAVWQGVNALLDNYARVQPNDMAIIAYTPDSHESAAWVSVALETRGITAKLLPMEPLSDANVASRLAALLPSADDLSGRMVVFTFELQTMSHTEIFRKALSVYEDERCIVIRALGACPELFSQALRVSPNELSALNATIIKRCMPARNLRIVTAGGTDLRVGLDSQKYRWISNRGIWRPGSFIIIPSGEVATFPASISGRLVADFSLHVNMSTSLDVRLGKHPITVDIENGKVVNYQCSDFDTKQFLDECFEIACADTVGELGLGTNTAVAEGTSINSHINERKAGVHLGFGQHNQRGIISRSCNIHLDLIARGGLIWIDAEEHPLDLENIRPTYGDHPDAVEDEDVFSPEMKVVMDDCCGILGEPALSEAKTKDVRPTFPH